MKDYVRKKLFDPYFGIHPKALAIAHLLGDIEMDLSGADKETVDFIDHLVDIKTFPFYNGREHGICLTVNSFSFRDECLFVVFGEHRNSDSIFIDSWKGKHPFNNPTTEYFSDEAYSKRKFFSYNEIEEAADFIRNKVKEHLELLKNKDIEQNSKKVK